MIFLYTCDLSYLDLCACLAWCADRVGGLRKHLFMPDGPTQLCPGGEQSVDGQTWKKMRWKMGVILRWGGIGYMTTVDVFLNAIDWPFWSESAFDLLIDHSCRKISPITSELWIHCSIWESITICAPFRESKMVQRPRREQLVPPVSFLKIFFKEIEKISEIIINKFGFGIFKLILTIS